MESLDMGVQGESKVTPDYTQWEIGFQCRAQSVKSTYIYCEQVQPVQLVLESGFSKAKPYQDKQLFRCNTIA